MLSTQIVANTILILAFEENVKVTPMKLQKLMYFVYKDYLKETDTPLFSESFQKWKYGPVLSSIYYEFNTFGAGPINKFARDASGNVEVVDMERQSLFSISIRRIWQKYKHYSGVQLSELTHMEDTAWSRAVKNNSDTLLDEDIKNEEETR